MSKTVAGMEAQRVPNVRLPVEFKLARLKDTTAVLPVKATSLCAQERSSNVPTFH